MPGITGAGTTYNLPNYTGELFSASPEDTPFLSAIGGLTGGKAVNSQIIQWQGYQLRDVDTSRQRVEGAAAPTADTRARFSVTNALEIHQEIVEVSYSRQAATGFVTTDGAPVVSVGNSKIPADELAWQVDTQLKQIARDVDASFITGTYQLPTDGTKPRKTRGLLNAITTNKVTSTRTAAQMTQDDVLDIMQKVYEQGGIQESGTRTIIVGAQMKRALSKAFVDAAHPATVVRNVGGVNLQVLDTDFGQCNIMLDRYVPNNTLLVVSLEQCVPCFLEIPGKGTFFAEPLAKTGATDRVQVYGEIGLQYGAEASHGVLTMKAV